jgi:hypothetical protein
MVLSALAEGISVGLVTDDTMIEPTPLIRETEAVSPGAFLHR